MKRFESWCLKYAERWNKKPLWAEFCLVKDAWLAGYHEGVDRAISLTYNQQGVSLWTEEDTLELLDQELRKAEVEVTLGSNQIGQDVPKMTVKRFKEDMEHYYNCEDLRVDEKDGVISFQGVIKI